MRDEQIRTVLQKHTISLHEYRSNGVMRNLQSRDVYIQQSCISAPTKVITVPITSDTLPDKEEHLFEHIDYCPKRQLGGRSNGLTLLQTFLKSRGKTYQKDMSSPVTGWINFRMRAILMSFASYHLWLHWRKTSLHLAQLFTDYETGIHYSQTQMQSDVIVGDTYPLPIVEHTIARKQALDKISRVRKQAQHKKVAHQVFIKRG